MWQHGEPSHWSACDRPEDPEQCYGEITPDGMRRLLWLLPSACALRPDSVLYDIGSGFGRFAAFLRTRANVSHVVGLEVNECRARRAAHLNAPGLELRHGDVRRLGFDDATHVFMTSACWGEELLRDLFGRLAHRSRRLGCIVNFCSLPHAHDLAALVAGWGRLAGIGQSIAGTWDPHAAALYIRKGACSGNGSSACVRRMRRRLATAAKEAEAAAQEGESPWRRPPAPWRRTTVR